MLVVVGDCGVDYVEGGGVDCDGGQWEDTVAVARYALFPICFS